MKRRILCGIIAIMMMGCLVFGGCGNTSQDNEIASSSQEIENINKVVLDNLTWFIKTEVTQPTYGMVGGEWTMFDLTRAGVEVEESYIEDYLDTVEQALISTNGVLNERRYTEYSRVVIALSALGVDVTDVAGYNLIDYLSDYEAVCKQGLSGPIWALIAMDSLDYEFSTDIEAENIASREAYISYILERTHELGGWGYDPYQPDPDLTSMAIIALAPYAKEDVQVNSAIESGITVLSELQGEDGSYESGGVATAESCAQVVLALAMMDIDADTDERFIKNGISVYDALISFALEDGSFSHIKGDGFDMLATEQTCYCLIGYDRFLNEKADVFDLSDLK